MDGINPELVRLGLHAVRGRLAKQGFVPSDAVAGGGGGGGAGASGGGAPAAAAGPPAGGADAGGAGGAGGGGGAGAGGGGSPGGVDLMSALPQMVQSQVQQAMMAGGAGGAAGGAGAGAGAMGKPAKPDINSVAMDVFQLKKMFLHFLKTQGIELPPDILDGPNRDPATGVPVPLGQGTSDPNAAAGGGQAQGQQPQSAISPVQPMEGAFPTPPGGGAGGAGGGGGGKQASAFAPRIGEEHPGSLMLSRAAALARMCRQRTGGEST